MPLLVDLKPSGRGYMQDFHNAGGVPALLKALTDVLDLSTIGVDGKTLGERLESSRPPQQWQDVIRTLDARWATSARWPCFTARSRRTAP